VNYEDKFQVQNFVNTILARLSSAVTDKVICDIFCLFTEHAKKNLASCQIDTQLKIILLLQRHFEKDSYASIEWLMLFFFDYFSAQASNERRVELSERVLEFIGNLIS